MTLNEYQEACKRTECNQGEATLRLIQSNEPKIPVPVRLTHAIVGLSGETGELASLLQQWLWYGRPCDLVSWKAELGDCLWYIALACNAMGLSMEEVMAANIRKLAERFPDKFDQEKEVNRKPWREVSAIASRPDIPHPLSQTVQCGICNDPNCDNPGGKH